MHYVEINGDFCWCRIWFGNFKRRLLCGTIDGGQRMEKVQVGIVFFNIFHQRRNVFLDPEQNTTCVHELDIDVLEYSAPEPRVT